MRFLQTTAIGIVFGILSQATALEPICQVLVYDNNPAKPVLQSKTVTLDSDPIDVLGFSFSAKTVAPIDEAEPFSPVRLRLSRSGYVASSLMRWRVGSVQLSDPAGRKAVGRCQR